MRECGVCYETSNPRFFPCNHSVCHSCYDRLIGDNCPFCRAPFRQTTTPVESVYNDPEYWLDYDRSEWTVMSRFLRSGSEVIRVFRNNEVPDSWRNDSLTTVVKRRRRLRGRLRR
jgi:hypothetical protein